MFAPKRRRVSLFFSFFLSLFPGRIRAAVSHRRRQRRRRGRLCARFTMRSVTPLFRRRRRSRFAATAERDRRRERQRGTLSSFSRNRVDASFASSIMRDGRAQPVPPARLVFPRRCSGRDKRISPSGFSFPAHLERRSSLQHHRSQLSFPLFDELRQYPRQCAPVFVTTEWKLSSLMTGPSPAVFDPQTPLGVSRKNTKKS